MNAEMDDDVDDEWMHDDDEWKMMMKNEWMN